MRGNPDSGGIWAPCLSWRDGVFHLIYTNVRSLLGMLDTHNHLVTAPSIEALVGSGVPEQQRLRPPRCSTTTTAAAGCSACSGTTARATTLLRHPAAGVMTTRSGALGPVHRIFLGSSLRVTEGPHL